MLKNLLVCLGCTFLLCGCFVTRQEMMQSWVGSSKDNLLMKWGSPTAITNLSDGGEMLEYVEERQIRVRDGGGESYVERDCRPSNITTGSISYNPFAGINGGYDVRTKTTQESDNCVLRLVPTAEKFHIENRQCKSRFKVDKSGVIVSWAYDGC